MKSKYLANKGFLDIVLSPMTEKARETGLPRDHFEKVMLYVVNSRRYSEEEKVIFIKLVKSFLDKAFKN